MTTRISGFDIYHGNGHVDFSAAKHGGNQFVIAKASQGLNPPDSAFAQNRILAKKAGLLFGAYHYFTSDDPIAQADHLIAIAKPVKGELVLTLDVEALFDSVAAAAHKAAQRIKDVTGRWPIIYTGQSFYQDHLATVFPANMFALWIARYGAEPTVSPIAFWQYSETGKLAGHTGDIDLDYFMGTMDQLKAHLV